MFEMLVSDAVNSQAFVDCFEIREKAAYSFTLRQNFSTVLKVLIHNAFNCATTLSLKQDVQECIKHSELLRSSDNTSTILASLMHLLLWKKWSWIERELSKRIPPRNVGYSLWQFSSSTDTWVSFSVYQSVAINKWINKQKNKQTRWN